MAWRKGPGGTPGLRFGDDGAGLFGEVLPAVDLLPGANADLRTDRGHAVPGNVEVGDVAHAPAYQIVYPLYTPCIPPVYKVL